MKEVYCRLSINTCLNIINSEKPYCKQKFQNKSMCVWGAIDGIQRHKIVEPQF